MSIDWSSILSTSFTQTIPLLGKIVTVPFVLCISIPIILGGAIFKNKAGSSLGAFIGLFLAKAFDLI